jgi:hypothetical protein
MSAAIHFLDLATCDKHVILMAVSMWKLQDGSEHEDAVAASAAATPAPASPVASDADTALTPPKDAKGALASMPCHLVSR